MFSHPSLRRPVWWLLWLGLLFTPASQAVTTSFPCFDNFDTGQAGTSLGGQGDWFEAAPQARFFYTSAKPIAGRFSFGNALQLASGGVAVKEFANLPAFTEVSFWAFRTGTTTLDATQNERYDDHVIFDFNGVRLALTDKLRAWDSTLGAWQPVTLPAIYNAWYNLSTTDYYNGFRKLTVTMNNVTGRYGVSTENNQAQSAFHFLPENWVSMPLQFSYGAFNPGYLLIDDVMVQRREVANVLIDRDEVPDGGVVLYDDFDGYELDEWGSGAHYFYDPSVAFPWVTLPNDVPYDDSGAIVTPWLNGGLGPDQSTALMLWHFYQPGDSRRAGAARTLRPLPEGELNLSFWMNTESNGESAYPAGTPLEQCTFLEFNGIRLALRDKLYAYDSSAGSWRVVDRVWRNSDYGSLPGWTKLEVKFNNQTRQYALLINDETWLTGVNFVPVVGNVLLHLLPPVERICYIDDLLLTGDFSGELYPDDLTWDSDCDGVPDFWERKLGRNPYTQDAHVLKYYGGYETTLWTRYELLLNGKVDFVTGLTMEQMLGGGSGGSGNGGPTNPGYKEKKDSDGDDFTDYQEAYFGYNKDNKDDHPPTPRYVVIDLGAGKTPKYISEQNGWIVCGNGQRWHQGQWQQLVPARVSQRAPNSGEAFIPAAQLGICDIGNDGTVVCDGLIVSQSGMSADALASGVYWNTAGGIAEVPRTTDSQYGAHRWIQKLLENGKTISHLAHAGDSGILHADGFHHYNFGRHSLDQCDFLTGQVGETNQEPWRYTPTWINRAGGLLFSDQPTAGQSLVMASGNYPPSTSGLPANSWSYSAGLRSINHSGMGAGHQGGYPVYTLLEKKPGGNAGEGKVCLLPVRPGLPVEPALWINKQTGTDTAFMITSQSQVWLPKATGGTVDALFGPPVQLASLVDWNCGWVDKWNITGINDAGYLIGIGYKIKSGQETLTDGGELVIDFNNKQYSVPVANGSGGFNHIPTSAIEQHGFLLAQVTANSDKAAIDATKNLQNPTHFTKYGDSAETVQQIEEDHNASACVIFYKDAIDANFKVKPFSIGLSFGPGLEDCLWNKVSGPNSGKLVGKDSSLSVCLGSTAQYVNPEKGGVYEFLALYAGKYARPYVVLPLAGAEIKDIVENDLKLADAFAVKVNASYNDMEKNWPPNLFRWFYNYGSGDYVGRPNNISNRTIWKYNQVEDRSGLGAVATWHGYPVRMAKVSNFVIAYGYQKIGIPKAVAWAAQTAGTSNDDAASESWDAGWEVAEGKNYKITTTNLAKNIWNKSDEKNMKLWPNPAPADNHISGWTSDLLKSGVTLDLNRNFYSPGFLHMITP